MTGTPATANQPGARPEHPGIVEMSDVRFTWPGRQGFTLTVDGFGVAAGERVLLMGPSGSGKSTLLSLLAGIVTPQSGRVAVLGTDLAGLSSAARDRFRAEHMGIVFQMFNLLPYGSVADNVMLPLHFAPERRKRAVRTDSLEAEVQRLVSSLGIGGLHLGGLSASSLSAGQQQRVAAARALIGRPEIVIADEPTSALDGDSQNLFLDLLFGELKAAGATLIMVSHDERLASRFDRALRLDAVARSERSAS